MRIGPVGPGSGSGRVAMARDHETVTGVKWDFLLNSNFSGRENTNINKKGRQFVKIPAIFVDDFLHYRFPLAR